MYIYSCQYPAGARILSRSSLPTTFPVFPPLPHDCIVWEPSQLGILCEQTGDPGQAMINRMDDKVDGAGTALKMDHTRLGKTLVLPPPFHYNGQRLTCELTVYPDMYAAFWYHPDHLGSSSYITNLAGEITQHMEYLPFGETLVEEHLNSNNSPYKFNAKELDAETGNYYYGARYYNPKWSLFISIDPLAEDFPSWTPYHYVHNNPIIFIDPTGMSADWYENSDGNVVYDENIQSQQDLKDAGIDGTYLFEEGSLGSYDENGNLQGSYELGSDGSISTEGQELVESGFEEVSLGNFSIFGSTEASQNGSNNSDINMLGPVLLASGQPIKSLKPVGALGSKPGSSVASYVLSKALPQKLTFRLMGSTVLGRGLGRFIPVVGQSLLIYDAVKSDRMFDPALQGPRDMNNDIQDGVLNTNQMIKKYSCFIKGTQVHMADGSKKNIEDIIIGDKILSVNIKNMIIEADIVVDIPNTMQEYPEIKAEFSNGTVNHFSPAHPYWVKDKGWAVFDVEEAETELEFAVSQLEKGDVVLFLENGNLVEVSITILEPTGKTVEMFNVEFVKKNHTFFANGILVHNKRID